ncbi:FprA family A-type flavoprotein [Peptococcaceae bacterium]|nr:FprA family A-type flavoprotein [Peptococcaceae bacterium]
MQPVKLKDDIYWVGGIDWAVRNFHGYLTQRGSTYNAYLIVDEKITLIDTVKYYLCDEMLERISKIVDPSKIDYVVSNHVEMDHSGSLPQVMEIAKNATLITSTKGMPGLRAHYHKDWNFKVVKSGESIKIGKRTLTFVHVPMAHWPDSMVTYLPEDKILFSNDALGQHLASTERFDDEYSMGIIMHEAKKYYANILMLYDKPVSAALKAISGLEIDIVAPSHGIIWRSHIKDIVSAYQKWSANETENKAVIIYDSMWGSTAKVAKAIQTAFENKGIKTKIMCLTKNHISDVIVDVLDAKYICVGSPTLNNNMMPTVASFLTYMKGLVPKNRIGLAFGSFGWSGQSVGQVKEMLKDTKMELMKQVKVQYVPDENTLKEITEKVESQLRST